MQMWVLAQEEKEILGLQRPNIVGSPYLASSMIKIQGTSYFTTYENGPWEWLDSGSQPGRKYNPFVKKSCQQPPPTSHPYPLTPALYYPAGEGRNLYCFPPVSVDLKVCSEGPSYSLQ